MSRRVFTREFKLAAIKELESGKQLGYVARRLEINPNVLHRWRREFNNQPVHHSDRGIQYAAADYTDLLKDHGIQISMSRRGNPYDNAKSESFMKTLSMKKSIARSTGTWRMHGVRLDGSLKVSTIGVVCIRRWDIVLRLSSSRELG